MQVDLTLKNYRCFSDAKPARISIKDGFTAFVGVNNSGKSSLLKLFYELRNLFSQIASEQNLVRALNGSTQPFTFATSILDNNEVFFNGNGRDLTVGIRLQLVDAHSQFEVPVGLEIRVPRGTSTWQASLSPFSATYEADSFRINGTMLLGRDSPLTDLAPLLNLSRSLSNTFYVGPFRNALNISAKEGYFDIQVGQALISAWRSFKTGNIKRNNEAALRLTEDLRRVFGFRDLEINPSSENDALQVFVDGRSYRLNELGSGLTQFFIVLANASRERPSFVLIDEPELNLHPTLQREFLMTLASYATEGIIFATHSIGLARASAEMIYSVRKDGEGRSEVTLLEDTPRLSEFLGELCFSGYRDLGFNKVLLVEGASEVKTMQQFLRMYEKDHMVVLLPLGGGQLINESSEAELQEIRRISNDISALIDSERSEPDAVLGEDRTAFREICGRVGIRCHVLDRRAIENYFTDGAVKRVLGEKYQALKPYERLEDADPSWGKSSNWRIAREMRFDEVGETDLGHFLASL